MPRKSQLPEGKTRIQLTLTADTITEFKKLAKEIGMEKNFMSFYLDEQLFHSIKMMKEIKKLKEEDQEIDFPAVLKKVLEEIE